MLDCNLVIGLLFPRLSPVERFKLLLFSLRSFSSVFSSFYKDFIMSLLGVLVIPARVIIPISELSKA